MFLSWWRGLVQMANPETKNAKAGNRWRIPRKLRYMARVEQQLANNNVNGCGSFIEAGLQEIDVRSIGLLEHVDDIREIAVEFCLPTSEDRICRPAKRQALLPWQMPQAELQRTLGVGRAVTRSCGRSGSLSGGWDRTGWSVTGNLPGTYPPR